MKKLVNNFLMIIIAFFKRVDVRHIFDGYIPFKLLLNQRGNINGVVIDGATLTREIKLSEGVKFISKPLCYGNIEIGRHVAINGPSTKLLSKINKIIIGSFTSIAANTTIQEFYHRYDKISTFYLNKNIFKRPVTDDIISKGDITIGEDVWIGTNCVILSGITIGRGCVIGAGSIVTKSIPPYSIAAGNPARVIKSRFKQETIDILETIKWWDWSTEKIIKNQAIFNMTENEIISNRETILLL